MDALSRLWIGCDEPLGILAQQVVSWLALLVDPWVALSVAPPVGPARVGHGCGVPPAVRAHQGATPSPLELVAVLRWQGFAPLELAAATLEAGGHPTCPSL